MANYLENTKANLPHKSQSYSSPYDNHPIYGNIGGWVCDTTTAALKYKLNKTDWSKKMDGSLSNLTGTDGDVMVKIPAFFMRVTRQPNGKPKFEIDDTIPDIWGSNGKAGFFVHPAFKMANGQVRPYFLWGAYEGYIQDTKLRSVSGVLPTVSKTKAAFQDAARQGRSIDYGIMAVYEAWAVQLLMYVEFGTLNLQEAVGRGIVDFTWDEGLTTHTEARKTGLSNSLGDRSGYVENGEFKNGKCAVRWRGIENPWGGIWKFLSGIMVTDKGWHYTNDHSKMDTISSMSLFAKDLSSKVNPGYLTDMEFPNGLEWTFIPKSTGGSDSTYYCDYFYTHDTGEENIVLAGGSWSRASEAGVASWHCVYVASYSNSDVGARLSYAAQ